MGDLGSHYSIFFFRQHRLNKIYKIFWLVIQFAEWEVHWVLMLPLRLTNSIPLWLKKRIFVQTGKAELLCVGIPQPFTSGYITWGYGFVFILGLLHFSCWVVRLTPTFDNKFGRPCLVDWLDCRNLCFSSFVLLLDAVHWDSWVTQVTRDQSDSSKGLWWLHSWYLLPLNQNMLLCE